MRKILLSILSIFMLFALSFNVHALSLPSGQALELDVVGYSGLFRFNDQNQTWEMLPSGAAPQIGDESRAIFRITDIDTLEPSVTGVKAEGVFKSSNNTQNLFIIEKGVYISDIFVQADGSIQIFFNEDKSLDSGYQLEAYLDSALNWPFDFIDAFPADPAPDFDALYAQVALNPLLWAGWFADSTYDGIWGSVDAKVGINLDLGLLTGDWIENNELYTDTFGFINPQAWVTLDPLYAGNWNQNFFGTGKALAIGNVSLDAASSFGWTTYADDWTRGVTVIPEPSTMLLLGAGLLGLAAFGRRKFKK